MAAHQEAALAGADRKPAAGGDGKSEADADRKTGIGALWERIQRVPPVAFVLAIQRRWSGALCGDAHGHLVYSSFKAIFPLLLAALAVLGFVASDESARQAVVDAVSDQFPTVGDEILVDNLGTAQDLRTFAGIVAFLGLLWIGIGLIETVRAVLDRIWAVPTLPNAWLAKLRSFAVLGILGVMLLASLGGTAVASALLDDERFGALLVVASIGIAFVIDVAIVLVAYKLLPSGRQTFRQVIVGAILAAVVLGALRNVAFYLVPRWIENASAAYGTLASVIALLTFLDFSIRAFIYGAIVNAERADRPVTRPVAGPAQPGPGEPANPAPGGAPAQSMSTPGVAASTTAAVAAPARRSAERGKALGFLAIGAALVFGRGRGRPPGKS